MMELVEVSWQEYKKSVNPRIVFDGCDFLEINKYKVDEIKYFLVRDNKVRFGFYMGVINNEVRMPFSAPFALVEPIKAGWTLTQLEEFVDEFIKMINLNYGVCKLTLPPIFYDTDLISSLQNILYRKGARIDYIDLNYAFCIRDVYVDDYKNKIARNARKNLAISLKSELKLIKCETTEQIKEAYQIIKSNREAKGYPLRMSQEQVLDTINIVKHDFFIVNHGNESISAAQIFHVNEKIVQVIYWGDKPGFSQFKSINYLAYQLIQYYGERGFEYIDIGPSTENGNPNYGLCDFKTSIGCETTPKITFSIKAREIHC